MRRSRIWPLRPEPSEGAALVPPLSTGSSWAFREDCWFTTEGANAKLTNRIVLAYFGDQESTASIAQLVATRDADVIAVALDLGDGVPLAQLRDGALAAGATRCHALDVREEFAREAVIPALRANALAEPGTVLPALARDFFEKKLREIADIERAAVTVPPHAAAPQPVRRARAAPAGPAHVEIHFADGSPYAVNGIPMSLTELMESIETITATPAIEVLQLAYQQLDLCDEGQVVLQAHDGTCTVTSAATTGYAAAS